MHYLAMTNELGNGKVLTCPADRGRTNFAMLFSAGPEMSDILRDHGNDAISYFVGLDAREGQTGAILGGDWHVETSAPKRNLLLTLSTNDSVGWTPVVHEFSGNILLADGSVSQTMAFPGSYSTNTFQALLLASPLATNRWLMPR